MNHKTRTAYDGVQKEPRTFLQDFVKGQIHGMGPVINIPTADHLTCLARVPEQR